ncbi:unnamed protein product, partial [marine sediment metagenome]
MINTIPDKIPKQILKNLKKGIYDKIILFALGVFGSHKLREFVNDPNNSIKKRMDKALFLDWVDQLKEKEFIEEFELDNEINYIITPKGEDEILKYLISLKILKRLEKILIDFIDPTEKNNVVPSKSV